MREPLDMLAKTVRKLFLDCVNYSSMKRAPAILQQAAIGDLMCERVFKCVLDLRKKTCLIQKLRCLKPNESTADFFLRRLGDGLEKHKRNVFANDSRRLQHTFFVRWKSINPSS